MNYSFPVPELIDQPESAEVSNQIRIENSTDEISTSIERFFQSYSPKTVIAYKNDLKHFIDFAGPLQDCNEQDVLKYIKHLEANGFKNSSINRRIAALSKIWTLYCSLGITESNVIYSLSKISKLYKPVDSRAVEFNVTRHDVEAVIKGSRKKTSVIVKFLVNTGLRISEMIQIKKEDVEAFNSEFLRVKITGKGGKIRFVFISYSLYNEVKTTFNTDSIYLFASKSGQMLSRINIYKQVKRQFAKLAFKQVSPHDLRHLYSTLQIRAGIDMKALSLYLGHSSVSTTLNLYVHTQISPDQSEVI